MSSLKLKLEADIRSALLVLVTKYRNGDTSVREDIAVLLLPYVKLIVTKYKSSIKDDPLSMAGWIITKLLNKIDKIDMTKSYVGFICRMAINECIDTYRGLSRKKSVKVVNTTKTSWNTDTSYTPASYSEDVEFYLEDIFNPADLEVISMYHIQNKTFKEISVITGQSELQIKETLALAEQFPST